MPPKPKFTKEEMINAAIDLISEKGESALTARELGKQLGCSSCPIFTLFNDMNELKAEVKKKAVEVFDEYMSVADAYCPAYKKRGMQWVKFAEEQPRLFRLLFMRETPVKSFDEAQKIIPFGKQNDINIIMRDYNATHDQAEHLFKQMWIFTYGLCALVANKVCSLTEDETSKALSDVFRGMVYVIKSNGKPTEVIPVKRGSVEAEELEKDRPNLSDK